MIVIDILVYIGFWAMVYGTYCLFRRTPPHRHQGIIPQARYDAEQRKKVFDSQKPL